MKVVILSAGSVASDVAARIVAEDGVDELVVADLDADRAAKVAEQLGAPATSAAVDATDPDSIAAVVRGAGIVFNGIGPYYRFGHAAIEQALLAGAHYVDICDEYDVTHALVTDEDLDRRAREAGLTVLTSMGAAPGLTNLAARWAADQLDSTDAIHIAMGLPLIVNLGVNINEHMLHSLDGEVIQYLDGQYRNVPAWADPRRFELLPPFDAGDYRFGYFGHAEAASLPRYLPGLREVTTRFTWFQPEGNRLYQDLARLGLTATDDTGLSMTPRRFLSELMASEAGQAAMSVPLGDHPAGHLFHVEAEGELDGAPATVTVEGHVIFGATAVSGASLTAVPAAAGIRALLNGAITRRGVVAPEACIDPEPFLRAAYAECGVPVHRRITRTQRIV
jgi:saccharopine dehydrogenase (NAD+, L-lysine-forming)